MRQYTAAPRDPGSNFMVTRADADSSFSVRIVVMVSNSRADPIWMNEVGPRSLRRRRIEDSRGDIEDVF